MPRPGKDVHGQHWCVGKLHKEDLLPWDLGDLRRIVTARKNVKAVNAQPYVVAVNQLHDLP